MHRVECSHGTTGSQIPRAPPAHFPWTLTGRAQGSPAQNPPVCTPESPGELDEVQALAFTKAMPTSVGFQPTHMHGLVLQHHHLLDVSLQGDDLRAPQAGPHHQVLTTHAPPGPSSWWLWTDKRGISHRASAVRLTWSLNRMAKYLSSHYHGQVPAEHATPMIPDPARERDVPALDFAGPVSLLIL